MKLTKWYKTATLGKNHQISKQRQQQGKTPALLYRFIHLQSMTYLFFYQFFLFLFFFRKTRCDVVEFTRFFFLFREKEMFYFLYLYRHERSHKLIDMFLEWSLHAIVFCRLSPFQCMVGPFVFFFVCRITCGFIMSDMLPVKLLVMNNNRLSLFFQ